MCATAHISSFNIEVPAHSKLITFELHAKGIATPLRALLDTGASIQFGNECKTTSLLSLIFLISTSKLEGSSIGSSDRKLLSS